MYTSQSKPLIIVLFVFMMQFSFAQKTFHLDAKPELKVSGTSTLHDWNMPSSTATGTMLATETAGKLTEIKSLSIDMPSESIKSGKKGMDKKAYEALKTSKHKTVQFDLKSASKAGDTWTLVGTFNIAGVTKQVSIKAKETAASGTYTLTGTHAFKLTEYGIEPPKAMMGTIKTGDDVKIAFNIKFK